MSPSPSGYYLIKAMIMACMLQASEICAGTMNTAVGFAALGHGPEWHLEIINNRNEMVFTTAAGTTIYGYTAFGPTLLNASNSTIYMTVNDSHAMSVVVHEQFCQDTKSGKAYGTTVTVWLDGVQFTGCGETVQRDTAR